MYEEIIEYLKNNPDGVPSAVLAEKFLKIKNAHNSFTHTAITSILSKDKRCFMDKNDLWFAQSRTSSQGNVFESLPLTAVFIIAEPTDKAHPLTYIALWELIPKPNLIWNRWMIDSPNQLSINQKHLLTESESFTDSSTIDTDIHSFVSQLQNRIPVYFSSVEHNILRSLCYAKNLNLNDDAIYMTDLLKASAIQPPQSVSPASCIKELLGTDSSFLNVYKQGELFSSCIPELLHQARTQGIETREDFDKVNKEEIDRFLDGKSYSYDQIYALPESEGIYGFKDKNDSYIYIGKTGNLKRKLTGFFRDISAVTGKLKTLLAQSYSLITHSCGSELESALYEYRLIGKYSPSFNPKVTVKESDTTQSISKCVIVQPHISDSKIMVFLVNEHRKTVIKSLDIPSGMDEKFLQEIQTFFFENGESAETMDPAEKSIINRWLQYHTDSLSVIPVQNLTSPKEVLEYIKNCSPL